MSKYTKIINGMVTLYQKNIWFAYLFCLIAIGITGMLYIIPITAIRVILTTSWWYFSFSLMIASLAKYKYGNKKEK